MTLRQCVGLSLFYVFVCSASQDHELFLRAGQLYKLNDYQQAYTLYESIPEKTSAVWHNMGNCCYQQGDYEKALVWWKKAVRGATSAELAYLAHNICLCQQKLGHDQSEPFLSSWRGYWYKIFANIPLFVLQLLFLLALYLVCCIHLLVHNKRLLIAMRSMLVLVLLVLAGALVVRYSYQQNWNALVKSNGVKIYAGPDTRYHVLGEVSALHEVQVLQQRDSWCKIGAGDMQGWVCTEHLELV